VTASTRTPTKKQGAVLFTLSELHRVHPEAWPGTTLVTEHLARLQQQMGSQLAVQQQKDVFASLNAFARHGWVHREVSVALERDNEGSHLRWHMTDDGRDALQRALQANQPKENTTVETETPTAPPVADAPWSTEPNTQGEELEQEVSLSELDEEEIPETETEIEEDDNPPVNEASSQLTLAIGGPKPIESSLKIRGHQQKFGVTRQFKNLERIPITAWLEVRRVAADVQNNGKVHRMHEAILTEIVFDAELEDA